MENTQDSSETTNSVSLLRDIIRYYHAKKDGCPSAELPLVKNSVSELFNFEFTEKTIHILEIFLRHRRTLSETYKSHYITLWNLFTAGEPDLLYLLLKHNILDAGILENYPEIRYEDSEEPCENMVVWGHGHEFQVQIGNKCFRLYDSISLYPFLHRVIDYDYFSARRLRKILWGAVSIVSDESDVSIRQRVECLRTLYNFIREPHITGEEIYDVIKYVARGHWQDRIGEFARGLFENYFPESKQPCQPRSLKHLSRWTIQQSLRDAGKFPDGVAKLRLPPFLKAYVLSETPSTVSGESMHNVNSGVGMYDSESITEDEASIREEKDYRRSIYEDSRRRGTKRSLEKKEEIFNLEEKYSMVFHLHRGLWFRRIPIDLSIVATLH